MLIISGETEDSGGERAGEMGPDGEMDRQTIIHSLLLDMDRGKRRRRRRINRRRRRRGGQRGYASTSFHASFGSGFRNQFEW